MTARYAHGFVGERRDLPPADLREVPETVNATDVQVSGRS